MTSSPEIDGLRNLAANMDPDQLGNFLTSIEPLIERISDLEYDENRLASWSHLLSDISIATKESPETSKKAMNLADEFRKSVRMIRRNPIEQMAHSTLARRIFTALSNHKEGLLFDNLVIEANVAAKSLDGILRPMMAHGIVRLTKVNNQKVYSKGVFPIAN